MPVCVQGCEWKPKRPLTGPLNNVLGRKKGVLVMMICKANKFLVPV